VILPPLVFPGAGKPYWKGKAQYSWPPCANYFISDAFDIEKHYLWFYKTSHLIEEVNRTEPSPLVSVPWWGYRQGKYQDSFTRPISLCDFVAFSQPINIQKTHLAVIDLYNSNKDKSAARFCPQVAAWVPDVFCNF